MGKTVTWAAAPPMSFPNGGGLGESSRVFPGRGGKGITPGRCCKKGKRKDHCESAPWNKIRLKRAKVISRLNVVKEGGGGGDFLQNPITIRKKGEREKEP